MDLLTRDQLRRLAQQENDVCISIYMPTFRYESDWTQNPTRFKNLIRDARDQLRDQGLHDDLIDDILSDAHARLDEASFWRNMSEGLAAFITMDGTEFYRLPLPFDEIAIAGERFHLKPLFPLIATNNRFYLLSMSQSSVRLYQGTHTALGEVASFDIPSEIIAGLQADRSDNTVIQNEPSGDGSLAAEEAADLPADPEAELRSFFETVDGRVREYLDGDTVPLVLAGLRDYIPTYQDVSRYDGLIKDVVATSNPEPRSPGELHEKAWTIVDPVFRERQREAAERFEQLYYQDGNLASETFHEIVPACVYSRVDTLFVPIGEHRWGRFDPTTNTVTLHEEQETGDEDLLDYAAVHAYLNGATVHALQPENMPGGRSFAATFRFKADVSATENG